MLALLSLAGPDVLRSRRQRFGDLDMLTAKMGPSGYERLIRWPRLGNPPAHGLAPARANAFT
jgi:hypothetical protein